MDAEEMKADDARAILLLDTHGTGLTGWEVDFVESCVRTNAANRVLSSAQRTKLWDIIGDRVPEDMR